MKGFLRRDASLLMVNARFYLVLILTLGALSVFSDFSSGFVSLYAMIFTFTSFITLFSYDEANHWTAYAAATPKGRRAMVDARYLLSLGMMGLVFLLQLALSLLNGEVALGTATLYAGVLLPYLAVMMPVSYRFGNTRARLIVLVVLAAATGLMASLGSVLVISSGQGVRYPGWMEGAGLAALGLGAAALALSWRISRRIMARREL